MAISKKKILLVTPRFPYPEAGACEQDRAEGIRQLKRIGFEVEVVSKYFIWQDAGLIKDLWGKQDVQVTLEPYKVSNNTSLLEKVKKVLFVLMHPRYLDGAVLPYRDVKMQILLRDRISSFKPDYVWFDYTYLWPLYKLAEEKNIPIIVRSINNEADHFIDENGKSAFSYIKYLIKKRTEKITATTVDLLFSITPNEQYKYKKLSKKNIVNLPLRALHYKLATHNPRKVNHLHVFFSGSTYNVAHNRKALEFILKDLAPLVYKKEKNNYIFHITGAKFPKKLERYIKDNIIYEGFVDNFEDFLKKMDIALVPSFFGAGMQQKIFEPLARGFPTITHERGLRGYPFLPEKDLLVAKTATDYYKALQKLKLFSMRKKLSNNSKKISKDLFSRDILDNIVCSKIENINR